MNAEEVKADQEGSSINAGPFSGQHDTRVIVPDRNGFPSLKEEVSTKDGVTAEEAYYKVNGRLTPSIAMVEQAIRILLLHIGEDPDRDGLKGTPDRVARALREMTQGYQQSPQEILARVFDEPYDEMVIVKGIAFQSLCEHHMLVFSGTCDIGYLPGKKGIVGLSKIARLVDCFSRRLQVQERMTSQIAQAIETHLEAIGVGVIARASHSCMSCRGARKPEAEMITSSMLGMFRTEASARNEFLSLVKS